MKTAKISSTINRSKSNKKEEGKMKKLISILGVVMVAATLAVSSIAAAETSVEGQNSAQVVAAETQFSVLDGVQAQKMNDSEMNEVEGKYLIISNTRYATANVTSTFVRPVCSACAIPINLP